MNKYRHYYSFNRVLLLILDVTLIAFAFKFSNLIRYGSLDLDYQYNVFFVLFALVWWIVSGFSNFVFRVDGLFTMDKRLANLINVFIMHAFILASCIVVFNLEELSRLLLLYTYLSTALLIGFSRLLLQQVYRYCTNSGMAHTRYVIVGTGSAARALHQTMSNNDEFGTKFMGFFDDEVDENNPYNSQVCGTMEDLKEYCLQHSIDEIYYTKIGRAHV